MTANLSNDHNKYEQSRGVWPGATEAVYQEVTELSNQGLDIELVHYGLGDHMQLDDDTQRRVNAAIEKWSAQENFLPEFLDPEVFPASEGWLAVAKRATALHAFYNTGSIKTPSDGIDPACLDAPLFDGLSAKELLVATKGEQRAARVFNSYDKFFAAGDISEGQDKYGLTFRDYFAGSIDRIADVTRAFAAIDMIETHVENNPQRYGERGIVSASLACGAAEPVFWLAKSLQKNGHTVDKIHLVDNDEISLAASTSRADHHGLDHLIDLHKKDILFTPTSEYIEPKSVDYVDLIGLFEYLPREVGDIKVASTLLAGAAEMVRPGGMIVFGNMLKDRPQQEYFSGIWPPLQQRSVADVLELIEEAGFSRDQVKVRIPEGEGVYALYGIEIPQVRALPETTVRSLGATVANVVPEY